MIQNPHLWCFSNVLENMTQKFRPFYHKVQWTKCIFTQKYFSWLELNLRVATHFNLSWISLVCCIVASCAYQISMQWFLNNWIIRSISDHIHFRSHCMYVSFSWLLLLWKFRMNKWMKRSDFTECVKDFYKEMGEKMEIPVCFCCGICLFLLN